MTHLREAMYQRICTVRTCRPAPTCGESFVGCCITQQMKRWLVDTNLFQLRHRQTQWIRIQWVISVDQHVSLFDFLDVLSALFSPFHLTLSSASAPLTPPLDVLFHFLHESPLHSSYRPPAWQLQPRHPSANIVTITSSFMSKLSL